VSESREGIFYFLLDSLGEGVIFFDCDDRVEWTNGTFQRMRGRIEAGDLVGRSIFDCHPSRDHEAVSRILDDLKTGRETTRYHRARRSGIVGAERDSYYDIFYTAVRNRSGDYLGTAMIIRDVGEIRNLEAQVARSEQRYKDLIENIDSGIFSLDGKGRITYANNGLLKMLGYRLNETINRHWTELFSPERRDEAAHILDRVSSEGKGTVFETRLLNQEGDLIDALINLSVLKIDPEESCMVRGIVTDITARKELERRAMERERFEGVIEMAGAACHHLNQPLVNILMRVQMLLKEMDTEDPHYRNVKILEAEALRMGNITRKIQNITSYETEPYVEGRSRIIDLERASGKKQ